MPRRNYPSEHVRKWFSQHLARIARELEILEEALHELWRAGESPLPEDTRQDDGEPPTT